MAVRFTAPRRIELADDVSGFHSGKRLLDEWLMNHAFNALNRGTAVTYVSHDECGSLAGFYSLSANSVNRGDVHGGWLARNTPEQIPVILLGMLAIDERYQGQGLGWRLLLDAVERAMAASSQIGARALIVDPLDDDAASFYKHFGFSRLRDSTRMFAKLV
ncbi:GNAT family acetyltransferase [Bifidobacterium lemurum]|uniref:GNAT family acetyltransferase n=1 Tax=Bifidobacterium lemurum TaxID=1603886 RepID=A0A261FUH5_9BIFI|nr:GNAT family N-acetyltransferase [Bifidobacterium lemurum]OZG62406.1 GNAT family acetyltransferase [Bifidobacterium lemurum]QOL33757.1 GNAT family N-acetyltransferase [Bifidobacterium lemurum]